jgi:hypothetical protein
MKQKNRMIRQLIFYSIIFFIAGCKPNKTKEKVFVKPAKPEFYQLKDTRWKTFTLRQKTGQTMLMLPDRKKELELGRVNICINAYSSSPIMHSAAAAGLMGEVKMKDHIVNTLWTDPCIPIQIFQIRYLSKNYYYEPTVFRAKRQANQY